MTGEHIAAVARNYHANLVALNIVSRENGQPLEHAGWMCNRIIEFVRDLEYDKANRWLGFVQGVLFAFSVYSIETMRGHNRSPADAKSVRSRDVSDLFTAVDAALFPGTDVRVGRTGEDMLTLTVAGPDARLLQYRLQVREVTAISESEHLRRSPG